MIGWRQTIFATPLLLVIRSEDMSRLKWSVRTLIVIVASFCFTALLTLTQKKRKNRARRLYNLSVTTVWQPLLQILFSHFFMMRITRRFRRSGRCAFPQEKRL